MEEESIPLYESLFLFPSFPSSFFLSVFRKPQTSYTFFGSFLKMNFRFLWRERKKKTKQERQEQRVGRSEVESDEARAHTRTPRLAIRK